MKRTIQDVDGDEMVITTEPEEIQFWTSADEISIVVMLRFPDPSVLSIPRLDELIAALQEARDEIVGRDAPSSAPADHADV